MSNNIKKAFHPSFYIRDYLDELQISQDEFSKRLGISGKQVSLLLSEEANITIDIAIKLSKLLGTSIDLWLNLQSNYDIYKAYLLAEEEIKQEKIIYKMIDKKFLQDLEIIETNDSIEEQIEKLRISLPIASLTYLEKNDIYSFYRTSINKELRSENVICRNVWVSIAFQKASKIETEPFNGEALCEKIDYFKTLTNLGFKEVNEILTAELKKVGVAFVVLPSLKNSNINGAVKWMGPSKVMMALNTRGQTNDKFWFSFFHELKHVLQQMKRKFIVGEDTQDFTNDLEKEADLFAREVLIPQNEYDKLKEFNESSIKMFSEKIKIHPGIVVGRLQRDGKINYNQFNYLKEKYEI